MRSNFKWSPVTVPPKHVHGPECHDNEKSQDDPLHEPLTDAALIKR